jgi:Capsule polysaccharide biosynthesis protein
MRFLVTTLQFAESDFYRRVSQRLAARGNEISQVVFSRRAARELARGGFTTFCLPDVMRELGSIELDAESARIEADYPIPSLRNVYISDPACRGLPERDCVERTVRHFLALERVMDEVSPDIVVPEVGSETMRTVAHLVGSARGATVFFLFYTIFPKPLRLYADTYHAPIVPEDEVRELSAAERDEVERFISRFTAAGKPILSHRRTMVSWSKLRDFGRHVAVRTLHERDNEYLRPTRFVSNYAKQKLRAAATTRLYEEIDATRPFVYFPLHVTDDFKIKRVIPHCADQGSLIRQVADALPQGYDLVLKEHPVSIGRNPVLMLRRLAHAENIRLVDPYTSSHDLIQRSRAVAVISSTVGLEALLYGKPVLTMGQPFYSGYGVTLDIDSFREIATAVPALLEFEPDRERILRFLHAAMRSTYDGAPGGVDPSDENASRLARSLDEAARLHVTRKQLAPA